MAIRVEHGKPSTQLTAAQMTGEARKQEEIQKMQMEFVYRQTLRQQDMAIDLQMQERAKLWEIDKMQLRSQLDFQREEQARQRKLDSADNALQQINKEVLSGRMTEQEAYPLKLKYEMEKIGVDAPPSLLPTGGEDGRYGVRPYYLEPAFERDYPELAEAKKKEAISGQRTGTIPWDLDPKYIRSKAAEESRANRGIFLEPEDIEEFLGSRVRVISPTGEAGSIERYEVGLPEYADYTIVGEDFSVQELPLADKQLDVGVRKSPEEISMIAKGRIQRIKHGTPVMSPLSGLYELYKAYNLIPEQTQKQKEERQRKKEEEKRKRIAKTKFDLGYVMSKGFK